MFLKIKANAGDDRSPYGNFWFEPVTTRTISGLRVAPETAMRLSVVYACVRILSEVFATLPFVLYRVKSDGTKKRITDHYMYGLLGKRPNEFQNAFEWREMVQAHLVLRGNAYNEIIANKSGEIEQLLPLHPDRVKLEPLPNGSYRYRYKMADGTDRILTRGQVWHMRGLSSDGRRGLSPLELARESIAVGLSAQDYGARFFANDAKPTGGWIEFPGQFKDKAARDVFRESWQAAQAAIAKGKIAVLDSGMQYHEVGVTNDDAQFLETRKFQITDIARFFRIPPHMVGDLEKATFSNIEQESLNFVIYSMTPWCERWEASVESELLLDDDRFEVEFDVTNLLRGDSKARSEYYNSGITGGWLVRNEARAKENLPAIVGLDKPLMPLNMQVVGEDAPDADDAAPPTPPPSAPNPPDVAPAAPPSDAPPPKKKPDGRLAALLETSARRLARRACRSDGASVTAELIGEALALPADAAQAAWLEVTTHARRGVTEEVLTAILLRYGGVTS